jgi:hypothetical protein
MATGKCPCHETLSSPGHIYKLLPQEEGSHVSRVFGPGDLV